ncbi:sulfurtransferase TusA family protein [Alkalihalobacillus pseudalcaliphilus]|uniref:sulfurtransferase TusA family protein n=1 Tax=Alkalihalobacillus pseudalcaliphilus TaxID=79884 RepID=UPI00064DEE2E|nr:sulfurtransferase TusA family protein [Alkalihalobacillus pseudalcaliphilus]KMK76304.1 hypothetical protein AB990_13945 [Alkalihalobacillus pseudalcaliphilus]
MIKSDITIDAKGLACPMPIVKTKKIMKEVNPGSVIEVQATDKGSTADLKAWSESTGHDYLGTVEEGDILKHYLRKMSEQETEEKKHPYTIQNEELKSLLEKDHNTLVIDVREKAEYAFTHVPGALSIPLGELEDRMHEVEKDKDIYVICRTGNRSDIACQKLTHAGFEQVINVIPGMNQWK